MSKSPAKAAPAAMAAPVSTPVRNSAIPKPAPARKEITQEQIARRAFEISNGPNGASEMENWLRAERELRGL